MIENNTLTQPPFLSRLESWNFELQIFDAILVALLTTVLSYQLTAIFVDIFFGRKPPGLTTAPALHLNLLFNDPFPLSLLSAICRSDRLDKLHLRINAPNTITLPRNPERIPKFRVIGLFFLVLVAPVFNLISIALTVEFDQIISFSQANFSGLGLGYNPHREHSIREGATRRCNRLNIDLPISARVLPEFDVCPSVVATRKMNLHEEDNVARIKVIANRHGRVIIDVHCPRRGTTNYALATEMFSSMHTNDGSIFRLQHVLTPEHASALIKESMSLVGSACDKTQESEPIIQYPEPWNERYVTVTHAFKCARFEEKMGREVLALMMSSVELVEVDEFLVKNQSSLPLNSSIPVEYDDASDMPYIVRRKKMVSQGHLCLTVLGFLLLRGLMKMITHNDVEHAMEAVLKSHCGTPLDTSMLSKESAIRYNYKYQIGKDLYFGVEQCNLEEVEEFSAPKPNEVIEDWSPSGSNE